MSIEQDPGHTPASPTPRKEAKARSGTHLAASGIAAFAVLAIGAVGGAAAMKFTLPSVELAPLTATSISSLRDGRSTVTIKGKVAEIFGNKFIVQDETGRALIETGPGGDDGKLVVLDEPINIQGRFDEGFLHASYLVHQDGRHQDGRTDALRPPPGPPRHGEAVDDVLRDLHR
ncbi:hypothetical protein [Rhizobium sp. S163]|uniref:hypothetical protein n=1 Tax=Rhizobium sp. S163 TaxID=3055039 RepID=UPI0025A95438|nr:hypothetical protein [Rhizobium sp. S163]MDM9646788.1 hypothetical protein [Rhizobium sp. S163]